MKYFFLVCFVCVVVVASGQEVTNYTYVVNDTNNPVLVTGGSIDEAQSYFLTGLEYGSGLAAILFGFISVRRALGMGDSWGD